jgi:hypothetical protein
MLKERLFYFIISLFLGLLLIYWMNEPPKIIVKHPNINKLTNVTFISSN